MRIIISGLSVLLLLAASASAQPCPTCQQFSEFPGSSWAFTGPQSIERGGGFERRERTEWSEREWSTPQQFGGGWGGAWRQPQWGGGWGGEFQPRPYGVASGGWPAFTFAPQITTIGRLRDRSPFLSGGLFTLGGRRQTFENGGSLRGWPQYAGRSW